jgi:hypothetical protein
MIPNAVRPSRTPAILECFRARPNLTRASLSAGDGARLSIGNYGLEFLTTMPVMTGPVSVFSRVKNFCSSFNSALAT